MSVNAELVDTPLWSPSKVRVDTSAMTALMHGLAAKYGAPSNDDAEFHKWSVGYADVFWSAVWDDCNVIGVKGARVVEAQDQIPGARWFPDARLNYAENLLRPRPDTEDAIVFRREDGVTQTLTFKSLCDDVSRCAQVLQGAGIVKGDRVAAYMPNCPETIIAMLAATSLGAIFSSASPDFGVRGVLDRFGQIEPKALIATNGYVYSGRVHDRRKQVEDIAQNLPSVSLVLSVPFVSDLESSSAFSTWGRELAKHEPAKLDFTRVPFDHPLFILFSSGTTGAPKCIVHSHGGTLLQHLKEHRYHLDIKEQDRVFYFTTCGWMMWNWLVSALALRTTLCLFDGSPAHPHFSVLFDYVDEEQISFFGTSAKFIDALKKNGVCLRTNHNLSSIRTIASTGSPLSPEAFDYVYTDIKADVHLASIAGGTDIIGCFVTGNPRLPVWHGEIQGPALAMDVVIFGDGGERLNGESGELVCANTFPSMPVGFWNDPDGSRYRSTYFSQFPGVWTHGDWVEHTAAGGFVIYGRSDATLNPGGVRIGTAEIYRVVERHPSIQASLVIGQDWQGDVRVILFVVLSDGVMLSQDLINDIKASIRKECSPRHTPEKILSVSDVPRTRSGKVSELAARDVVHGRVIKNTESLANTDVLDQYRARPELSD